MKVTNTILIFSLIQLGSLGQSGAQKRHPFLIKGNIASINSGIVRLSYYDLKEWKYDSAFIRSGKYLFRGYVSAPCKAVLSFQSNSQKEYSLDFWLDKEEIKIFSNSLLQNKRVIGGSINRDDSALEYSKLPIKKLYQPLLDTLDNLKDKDSISAYREKIYPYLDEIRKADLNFFASHPNSIITGFYLMPYLPELPLNTLQKIYSRFNQTMRSTIYGEELRKRIEILVRIDTGQAAAAFCGVNYSNNAKVCLQNFKGRYVLLDFWASWCLPCRKGTPHLIELFTKYRDSGLIVIGIADDDDNVHAWEQAIKKDGATIWYNILNGKKKGKNGQMNSSASITNKFGIQAFPTKILIDREGIIIGRYNGVDEEIKLDQKLVEIFK